MAVKLNLTLSNKTAYTLIAILTILTATLVAYAYNSGGPPSVIGHSADEVAVNIDGTEKTLQQAIDAGDFSGGAPAYDSGWFDVTRGKIKYVKAHGLGDYPAKVILLFRHPDLPNRYFPVNSLNLGDDHIFGAGTYFDDTNIYVITASGYVAPRIDFKSADYDDNPCGNNIMRCISGQYRILAWK